MPGITGPPSRTILAPREGHADQGGGERRRRRAEASATASEQAAAVFSPRGSASVEDALSLSLDRAQQ